jgi:hypothetical protein
MKFNPLTHNEQASSGMTHRLDFSYQDIPSGIANNTAKVWAAGFLPAVAAGDIIKRVELRLITPFEKIGTAGFNTTTLSLGDATTATRFVNASESNINGTEVLTVFPGAVENVIYTAAGQLQLTMNSMASQTISDLNRGQAYVLFAIDRSAGAARTKAPPFGDGNT